MTGSEVTLCECGHPVADHDVAGYHPCNSCGCSAWRSVPASERCCTATEEKRDECCENGTCACSVNSVRQSPLQACRICGRNDTDKKVDGGAFFCAPSCVEARYNVVERERDELRDLLREGAFHLYRINERDSKAAYHAWSQRVERMGIHVE